MRILRYCFLIVCCCFLTNQEIFSQEKIQVTFNYSDGKIFVFYEFQGDNTKDYEVEVKLKRTSDPDFLLIPNNLSGDIGKGKFANKKNKVIWELNTDDEASLEGEDFYFDVIANEISVGGGIPWYVYAGGAALAGGTAAVLLLGKKDNNAATTTPPPGGFPTPPDRP